MFSFLEFRGSRQPTVYSPQKNFVEKRLKDYYRRISFYTRHSADTAEWDHVLVKLIHMLHMDTRDLFALDNHVRSRYRSIARWLGIQVESHPIRHRTTHFFDERTVDELVVLYPAKYDIFKANSDWLKWSPVTVLMSPNMEISTVPMNNARGNGLAVIGVDPIALVLQYHCWVEYSLEKLERTQSIRKFVNDVVLVNALKSLWQCQMINMWDRELTGTPLMSFQNGYSIPLSGVTNVMGKHITRMKQHPCARLQTADALLSTVFTTDGNLMFQEVTLTRFNEYAYVMVILHRLSLMLELTKEWPVADLQNLRQFERQLARWSSNKRLEQQVPRHLLTYLLTYRDNVLRYI